MPAAGAASSLSAMVGWQVSPGSGSSPPTISTHHHSPRARMLEHTHPGGLCPDAAAASLRLLPLYSQEALERLPEDPKGLSPPRSGRMPLPILLWTLPSWPSVLCVSLRDHPALYLLRSFSWQGFLPPKSLRAPGEAGSKGGAGPTPALPSPRSLHPPSLLLQECPVEIPLRGSPMLGELPSPKGPPIYKLYRVCA